MRGSPGEESRLRLASTWGSRRCNRGSGGVGGSGRCRRGLGDGGGSRLRVRYGDVNGYA